MGCGDCRPPHESHYGVVPPAPPRGLIPIADITRQMEAAGAALGRLDALSRELADPWVISRIFPRREAVSSAAIENTFSTLDELLFMEEAGETTAGQSDIDATRQVRDYAMALDLWLPRAQEGGLDIFSVPLIEDLHRTVMRGDSHYQDRPGEIRTCVVWIGGGGNIAYSTYNPPPPQDVPSCLKNSVDYMRDAESRMTQALLTRMAIAHAHFEAVHPFRDGNGRVGRLLLPLMMAAEGRQPLYISPYIAGHKEAYYSTLQSAQKKLDYQPLIQFFAEAVLATVTELFATREALNALTARWQQRRAFRKGSASLRALNIVPEYPVLTIRRLAERLDVSIPAATTAIQNLVDSNILTERTGYARNRIFVATEALEIINRPFGEEPIL